MNTDKKYVMDTTHGSVTITLPPSTDNSDLHALVQQWKECLAFLPHGERIGYTECIEELEELIDGNKKAIELRK